jgi:hypothetical protein
MRLNNRIVIVDKTTHVIKNIMHLGTLLSSYNLVNTIVIEINKLFTPIICLMMFLQFFHL